MHGRFDIVSEQTTQNWCYAFQVFVVPPIVLALSKHPMVDQFDLTSLEWLNSGAAPLGAARDRRRRTRRRTTRSGTCP